MVVVAHEIFVSAQGLLVLGLKGFGAKGLGPGLDNMVLTAMFLLSINSAD